MLDKCASRQRVNRAGKYSSKKEDFNIMYRETCPFPSSFSKSRHPCFSRRQKFRRGFFPPGSPACRFSDDVPAGMPAGSGRAEGTWRSLTGRGHGCIRKRASHWAERKRRRSLPANGPAVATLPRETTESSRNAMSSCNTISCRRPAKN